MDEYEILRLAAERFEDNEGNAEDYEWHMHELIQDIIEEQE